MKYKILESIKNPNDLKKVPKKELKDLATEIRDLLCETAKKNDIHFSSNLGIVELTMSILNTFDLDKDIVLYDTGHQTYVHKILTGRWSEIPNIRKDDSLAGFTNMKESKYDHYSPGHSGNILSIASGMYQAYSEKNKVENGKYFINDKNIVAVVGDGAFANGLNFEALNDISFTKEPIIIILNDNDMSISQSVGSLSRSFQKMKGMYIFHFIERLLRYILKYNKMYYFLYNTFNWFQWRVIGKNLFENLGFHYVGQIDGHNFKELENALTRAKWYAKQGPVIVHVKTKKGKGSELAEKDNLGSYHSVSNIATKSYGMYATDKIMQLMDKNDNIRVINPAMCLSSNCEKIKDKYPGKFFDPGISEEHSISKASGMNLVGLKPYVYMYSSFLQRAYDQILHDLSRLDLNCTLLIDRADINGGDGSSHHGLYDISFLKTMHKVLISAPRNVKQLEQLIDISYNFNDSVFAIRYPKTDFLKLTFNEEFKLQLFEWEKMIEENSNDTIVISYGPYINKIYNQIKKENLNVDLVNAIFVTQYNQEWIKNICAKYKNIIIYERMYGNTGLACDFYEYVNVNKISSSIHAMNYKTIIEGGSTDSLDKKNQMHINDLVNLIKNIKN
ncbi:MAG: 1-deoxy-D-xylulose-5-phosphate synthase [Mycoplasma sp.]